MCCRWNAYRDALIQKKPPVPWKIPSCTKLLYTSATATPAIYLQLLIYCDIYIKLSVYLYYIVIENNCNLYKERKTLQQTFIENILSEMLKWILGLLKTLICSEDTKNSHSTIY